MNTCTGIWVDHATAHILRPDALGCAFETVQSGIDREHRSTGGKAKSRPYMHENGASSSSHHIQDQKNLLHKFYLEVEDRIGTTDNLLILGPGMAKHELRVVLQGNKRHQSLNIDVMTEGKVTDGQLKEQVMAYFGRAAKRHKPNVPGRPSVVIDRHTEGLL